ncbi:MAG: hypothetical protein ACREQ5_33855, partial [Candidatus Dormibacteria bacterium]
SKSKLKNPTWFTMFATKHRSGENVMPGVPKVFSGTCAKNEEESLALFIEKQEDEYRAILSYTAGDSETVLSVPLDLFSAILNRVGIGLT